jgi:hypothetical protein
VGQEVDDDHALVPVVPDGLVVRRERTTRGDGPYRGTVEAAIVIDYPLGDLGIPGRVRHPVLMGIVILGAIPFAVGFGQPVMLAAAAVVALIERPWDMPTRRGELRIGAESLRLAAGKTTSLADVRRVDVARRDGLDGRQVHEVIVQTPAGPVVVATMDAPAHAEHTRLLVEQAYRAHLRVIRP